MPNLLMYSLGRYGRVITRVRREDRLLFLDATYCNKDFSFNSVSTLLNTPTYHFQTLLHYFVELGIYVSNSWLTFGVYILDGGNCKKNI